MDKYTFIILMTLIVGLILFGGMVAVFHVDEKTSYGLKEDLQIIGDLTKIIGGGAIGAAVQKKIDSIRNEVIPVTVTGPSEAPVIV